MKYHNLLIVLNIAPVLSLKQLTRRCTRTAIPLRSIAAGELGRLLGLLPQRITFSQ